MSYNHEPQFNQQSASVQDICDYITMKREWMHYIEGYSDIFPDYYAYRERWRAFHTVFNSSNPNNIFTVYHELYNQVVNYMEYRNRASTDFDNLNTLEEVQLMALVSFSLQYCNFLMQRHSQVRTDLIQLHFPNDELHQIYEEYLDECDIVRTCNDCHERVLDGNYNIIDDETVCESCTEENYVWSEYMNEYIYHENAEDALDFYGNTITIDSRNPPDDIVWDEEEERWQHCDYEDRSIIGEYHSNRHAYSLVTSDWTRKNKRFFGVELEVEVKSSYNRHERAKAIKKTVEETFIDAYQPLVFERDGSLDNGFEIISQPMGLDKHRELWAWTNQPTITEGLRSHLTGTCGLHVHVSREGLTNLQIARAVYFVNHQANRHLIETIARRYNAGYCKAKSKKISTANRAEDRYEMINLQNRKTIEFRIFKGSLKYEAIISAIEFCHAVLNFAATNSNLHLSTEAFLKFIFEHQNRADTAYLRQYLMDRNPAFRKDFERLIKPEMKKLIPTPDLTLVARNAELVEV